jgi:hypothetical protein
VEQLGAGSRPEGVEALTEFALELLEVHGSHASIRRPRRGPARSRPVDGARGPHASRRAAIASVQAGAAVPCKEAMPVLTRCKRCSPIRLPVGSNPLRSRQNRRSEDRLPAVTPTDRRSGSILGSAAVASGPPRGEP